MKDVNKIILVGRLGSDPTLRQTKSGISVAQIPVATSRRTVKAESPAPTDGLGTKAEASYLEETEWHKVIIWRGQGEACAKYLKKGDKVYVEGSVRTRTYADKDGTLKYAYEIHAEDVSFLSDRSTTPRVPIPKEEFSIPEISL